EVVNFSSQARIDHRLRRVREWSGAMQDHLHTVESAVDGGRIVEPERAMRQTESLAERAHRFGVSARQDWFVAAGGRELGGELAGVAGCTVQEPCHARNIRRKVACFPTLSL